MSWVARRHVAYMPDEKFRKREHILKSGEFARVYRQGPSAKIGPLVLRYLANGLSYSRLGFSISSTNIRRASSRNRIKRLFREVYRKNKMRLKNGFDIVLIFRRAPQNRIDYGGAEELFFRACEAAKLTN